MFIWIGLFFLNYVLSQLSTQCRLEGSLHGIYKKQSRELIVPNTEGKYTQQLLYETVTISASSISDYGECYEKHRESYIFGQKRMGRSLCYRCVTPVFRTPNVVQLAHQIEGVCYDTISDAKSTCFDRDLLTTLEGTLLFRSESVEFASCGLDGRYSVDYSLRGSNLTCEATSETKAENCEVAARFDVQFRGCSFPDFDMSLRCLGIWNGKSGERYLIVENLENEEYRCGLLHSTPSLATVYFSNDSSCAHLNPQNSFEVYRFKPTSLSKPLSPCQFPEWLRGDYSTLSVTADQLQYNQGTSDSVPIASYCVATHGERILVYSESKCGDPFGYHCLWFRMRSDSVLEFKTTSPHEIVNNSLCEDDSLFLNVPWTTISVNKPSPVSCGLEGTYRTPEQLRTDDCYSIDIDCKRPETMKLNAYHCQSGAVFDSRVYSCLASWHDGPFMYLYTKRHSEDVHVCFITQSSSGHLYVSSSGAHCSRDFNFTNKTEKTLVLQQEGDCSTVPPVVISGRNLHARKPSAAKVFTTTEKPGETTNYETSSSNYGIPPTTSTVEQWEVYNSVRAPHIILAITLGIFAVGII